MQLSFKASNHGGSRAGSGRSRVRSRGIAHGSREKVSGKVPLHINFKYKFPIRNKETLKILKHAIRNARKHGLRILHFSFQSNHVHLIIEATSNKILTRGMRSLTITFAKRLKQGRIQSGRYHLHVLKTFREVKHAVHYVLFNQQKHETGTYSVVNCYSSVLSLENGLELIRKFALKKKITIKIENGEVWKGDRGMSYIYIRGFKEMTGDALNVPRTIN